MEFTNIHAYFAEDFTVKKYVIKEPLLIPDRMYIRSPLTNGKRTVYFYPSISIHGVAEELSRYLLSQE